MKQNNYQYQEIITITSVIQRFLEYLRAISFSSLFMILQYNTKIHHLKQEKCVRENLYYSYFTNMVSFIALSSVYGDCSSGWLSWWWCCCVGMLEVEVYPTNAGFRFS